LFGAPAAAQAFMSVTACASELELPVPPGGMSPPYHERHDLPCFTRVELVPLMYPWPCKYEYDLLALDISELCVWQPAHPAGLLEER
jgi:hypothetical protein